MHVSLTNVWHSTREGCFIGLCQVSEWTNLLSKWDLMPFGQSIKYYKICNKSYWQEALRRPHGENGIHPRSFSVQFSSVAQSCPTLCDPMDCSMPVVMYGCESWTIKKAEHLRIDAFELWCWRRLLRVPWTARRSNQSTLKEVSPECSLEGLMLNLKL